MSVLSGALHQTQHTHIILCKNVEFWCGASRSTKKYQHTISCAALCVICVLECLAKENISQGLLLNSLSSILSYNNFIMDQMFGQGTDMKKDRAKKNHQTSFLKQVVYFILLLILNLR